MANRIESTPEAAPAAGDAAAKAPAAAGGGIKAWLPLIITVVLMPVLAFAMTNFLLLPRLQKGLGITSTEVHAKEGATGEHGKKGEAAGGKKESVTMNKLLVNVAGTMGQRYLLVSVSVVGSDPAFKEKMQENEPQLRDMACGTLRLKTLADLEKSSSQNLIRTELISGFNN
ncbi:MAG TPA: flagellar basal body-associated FliL family protein, partial [Candidatus Paceibacterota bacterium]|nr:flagellar basal body-associated FliL family protein [Candidatus Paceibacterota bacterium]